MRAATAESIHRLALGAVRILPRVRGHGRLAAAVNRWTLRAGAAPVATARMKLGHRLVLDCRAEAQARALFTGQYEDGKILVLASLLPLGGCLLDAGANIGFYSVPLAAVAKRKGAHVIAAEPLPGNVVRLKENLELNDLAEVVTVLPVGLSSAARDAELVLSEDFSCGSAVGNASVAIDDGGDTKFRRVKVQLVRLDDIWPTLGAGRLDVVKADVEGHEDLLLEGARATLARYRPIILAKVNLWYFRRRRVEFDTAIRERLPNCDGFFRLAEPRLRLTTLEKPRELLEVNSVRANTEEPFLAPTEKVVSLHEAVAIAQRPNAAPAGRECQPCA